MLYKINVWGFLVGFIRVRRCVPHSWTSRWPYYKYQIQGYSIFFCCGEYFALFDEGYSSKQTLKKILKWTISNEYICMPHSSAIVAFYQPPVL